MEQTILVLVDVQEKLTQVMWQYEQLIRQTEILVQACRILKIPVLWCQQVPSALGPTIPALSQHLEDLDPIDKTTFSCWANPIFRDKLISLSDQNRNQLVIAGIEAHVCVFQTARDLIRQGYYVSVIADAISSRTAENRRVGLDRMSQEGILLSSVEMILFDLLEDSQHPQFRDVARLIK